MSTEGSPVATEVVMTDDDPGGYRAFTIRVVEGLKVTSTRAALKSARRKELDALPPSAFRAGAAVGVPHPGTSPQSHERVHAYIAVAAMMASVPRSTGLRIRATGQSSHSLGRCLADAVSAGQMRESAAESRLALLVKQSPGGLHRHLPGTVALLAARPENVDWAQLLADLVRWPDHRRSVARRWLQDFYRHIPRVEIKLKEVEKMPEDDNSCQ